MKCEVLLGRLGGLMMPELMAALLDGEASPTLRAKASDLMYSSGGRPDRYRLHTPPGARPTTASRRLQRLEDDRLRRWWTDARLGYEEVSAPARYLWHSWTRTAYGRWLGKVLRCDFGVSLDHQRPVADLVAERLPRTLLVQGGALLVIFLVGIPLGVVSGLRRGSVMDRALSVIGLGFFAAPRFWLATLALVLFGSLFPIVGLRDVEVARAIEAGSLSAWSWRALLDLAHHLVLPVLVSAAAATVVVARHVRGSVDDVVDRPWVRAAKSRGLSRARVLRRHVLRPSLSPVLTLLGILVPGLVAGSVVVESVFGIPGMGQLAFQSALSGDVPVVMAMVTLSALATLLGYLLADVAHALLDPRTLS